MERKVTDVNNYGIKEDAQNFNFIVHQLLKYVSKEQLDDMLHKLSEDAVHQAQVVADSLIKGNDWGVDHYANLKYCIDRIEVQRNLRK